MQTSNQSEYAQPEVEFEQQDIQSQGREKDLHTEHFIFTLVTLVGMGTLSLWIMQNSVNAYYQQTYHQDSPLVVLDDYPLWSKGGEIGDYLYQKLAHTQAWIGGYNHLITEKYNQNRAYTPEYIAQMAEQARLEKIRLAEEAQLRAHEALMNRFTLTKNDQVFFAGDSLMQGVAPYVQKNLQEKYEIKTINLSKQSTGLAYPKFFDWPQTIADTLKNNASIKVLVIFLGPNDPWDIPNPEGGAYLRFKSAEWEKVYRSRIANIIETAQKYQVSVMWLSPPNMRKESLNKQMIYLNQVVKDEVLKHKEFFIDSRPLLGSQSDVYHDYLVKDEKSIKVRSADGIHFSPDGQREIAHTIFSHLKFIE